MALRIDEEWIRHRVHLKHDNLDDVKSLSLPGSYHEKISNLGSSLRGFTRLKHLDLSRNAVSNLEGIAHLQLLETLNLYYNNISTLKDLYQLRTLANLQELDIRLNPVTKNEPDHRLFLIHMLPNLKKLDDRSVRDSERKTALMHFSTDQASEFTHDSFHVELMTGNTNRFRVARSELVRSLGPRSALDSDDVLLLDAIARKDNFRPNFISGSSSKVPNAEDYPRQELKTMHLLNKDKSASNNLGKTKSPQSSPHLHIPPTTHDVNKNSHLPVQKRHTPPKSLLPPYPTQGNFTPTPCPHETFEHNAPESCSESVESYDVAHREERERHRSSKDHRPRLNEMKERESHDKQSSSTSSSEEKSYPLNNLSSPELRVFHKLVDLVDKYWNGSKSLHNHAKFKELAMAALKSHEASSGQPERDVASMKKLREEMVVKEEELQRLSKQFTEQQHECIAIRAELERERAKLLQYEDNSQELTTLHARFEQIQEENQSLKRKLESQKDTVHERERQKDEVANNFQELLHENEKLKQRLDQLNANHQQLNELAGMLQESHRSLVATNDHLLLELAEEKDRHQSEVNQLHWSYKQLKKSVDWIPSAGKTLHKT